jgi:hypothetical protein
MFQRRADSRKDDIATMRSAVHVVRVSLLASTTSRSTSAREPRFRADWAGMTRKTRVERLLYLASATNQQPSLDRNFGSENLLLLRAALIFTAIT